MIKLSEVAQKLTLLIEATTRSEHAYRSAMTCLKEGNEKALFIYFWQEHAKMVCQLEDKVRWLGGLVNNRTLEPAWGTLSFKENTAESEIVYALSVCEHRDAELLNHYEYLLRTPLPVDVRTLLKVHLLKIKSTQARVLEKLSRFNSPAGMLPSIHERHVMGVDFHSSNPEDSVLGEVVLQA